jgi:hypothetical protein
LPFRLSGTYTEGSNLQSKFAQRLEVVRAEKRDIFEQRSGQWVDSNRRVILESLEF